MTVQASPKNDDSLSPQERFGTNLFFRVPPHFSKDCSFGHEKRLSMSSTVNTKFSFGSQKYPNATSSKSILMDSLTTVIKRLTIKRTNSVVKTEIRTTEPELKLFCESSSVSISGVPSNMRYTVMNASRMVQRDRLPKDVSHSSWEVVTL